MPDQRRRQLKKRRSETSRERGWKDRWLRDGGDVDTPDRERVHRRGGLVTPLDGAAPDKRPGNARPGVVVRVQGERCDVRAEDGTLLSAQVRGALRDYAISARRLLAAGDRVRFESAADGSGFIVAIEERSTRLSRSDPHTPGKERVIAANVERLAVVSSAANPDFKPGLIDRFLIAAQIGKVEPFIVVNKIDLAPEGLSKFLDAYRALGVSVILTSALAGEGVDALRGALAGRTTLFVGQSGVGKSSLLNAVQPGLGLAVGDVIDATGKGRHTTTSAWMLELEAGGRVIDTPGMRSFGLWGVDRPNLQHYFPEFKPFLNTCRLPACTHIHEPDCAVLEAADAGVIPEARLASYQAIYESLTHVPLSQS
jgi:ribosome biogenesis GTPase / thiamine phosphate phosphatase